MISLKDVFKQYRLGGNRRQTVTDHVNLTLEDKGLVVIYGASGSGKTTLLHLIGGMDRFDSGSIAFDSTVIRRFRFKEWDRLHRRSIAYVFQHHQLLPDKTVLMNLTLALRMRGLKNKDAIALEARSLLAAVRLNDYEDRLVRQLSGGQQQRVAVARGLAIGPDVLLADEPTGNLDSKNALELMRLFKAIARDRLVVLVTHNATIANHFADRILELENGAIVRDVHQVAPPPLTEEFEHQIHLDDYQKTTLSNDSLRIDRYAIDKTEVLNIDIIERRQTVFLKVDAPSGKRVRLLGEDGGVELVSGEKKRPDVVQLPSSFRDEAGYHSPRAFRFAELWGMALSTLSGVFAHAKRWVAVLSLIGIVVAVSVGLIGEANAVDIPVATIDPHYIGIEVSRTGIEILEALETVEGVDQVVAFEGAWTFRVATEPYFQVRTPIDVSAVPIDIRFLDETTLIAGVMPEGYGVVIDQSVADAMIEGNRDRGIANYEDILHSDFVIQASGDAINMAPDRQIGFPITGIADNQSQSVWMAEELIYSFITPSLIDYRILGADFQILEGDYPSSETYILLNEHYPALMQGDIPQSVGLGTGSYYISGIYRYGPDGASYNANKLMVSTLDYIRTRFFRFENGVKNDYEIMVYAKDVDLALANLIDAGYRVVDHRFDLETARRMKLLEYANLYVLGLAGLLLCGLSVFVIIRSQLIERRYEIGVYRGIGISRREVLRIFLVEAIVVAAVSSVAAFLLTVGLMEWAGSSFSRLSITQYSVSSILLGIAGLLVVHILFSLLPVAALLRKTPAELMKQSDL
jgi:ABC-type lipoprotein export system ATPase subunit